MAKSINKTINVWLNQQGIENNLKSVRSAITKTTNELAKLPAFSEEWYAKSQKLRELKDIYSQMRSEISATGEDLKEATKATDNFILKAGAIGSIFKTGSAALSRFVSATQEYVDAYASIDDAMSTVQKTTGMTREEVEALKNSLQTIDTRTSIEERLKISEIGGRIGLAKEEIESFTRSVDVANVALGDSFQGGAEEIATVLGKIRGAYQDTKELGIEDAFNSIGSALNSVGATCAATEGNVAQFAQRLGALPDAMKPSVQEAIGLGAAFENASINAEVAATAYGQLMTKAAANIGKFAAAMGEPVEEIRELLNTNPVEFMLRFAESMRGMPADELGAQLKNLKLNAVGVQEVIGAMSGQTDEFRRILEVSATEFAKGTSMMEEFGTVNNNAAAQLEKAKNGVQDAKAALGEELIPLLTKVTQSSASGLKLAAEAVKWISEHKALVIALAVAYNRQYIAHMAEVSAKKLSAKWGAIEKAGESAGTVVTNLFALAKAKLAKNTLAAANAQKALKVAFASTPWGAIITAVTTLVAAFAFMRDKTNEAAEAQQNLEEQITQQYNTEKQKVEDLQKIIENENSTRDQKLKAIEKLHAIIPEYVASLDKEGKVVNNNKNAINDYLVALKNKIRYQSLEKALNETENKIVEAEVKSEKARKDYFAQGLGAEFWDKTKSFLFGGFSKDAVRKNAEAELQGLYDIRAGYVKKMKEMDLESIAATGKTYRELYNDNLLSLLDDDNPPGSGSGSGDTSDKKILTRRENFQKKLQQMQGKAQSESLEGWEKTKQEILNKYKELETEAEALYGKDSEYFKEVQELKLQELSTSLDKYIKTLSDASDKMKTEAKKMLDESNPDNKETALIKAVFGEQQKWDDKFVQLEKNIANIRKILEDDTLLPESQQMSDEDKSKLLATLNSMYEQEGQLVKDNATAISNIIKQHTKSDTDFISAKENELSRARMNEHDRRVAEINEEYNLKIEAKRKEIETLKKLLKNNPENAARIEELEKIIEQLEELQAQETASVPKTSGSKSIWQQLAEFDWSKLKDNWQQALDLMTQGLQEFANTAFYIYNSIAQIQNNMMEAELQKAQETYDAKSAVLQKQLNSGVISQKYYDAKMAKLQEEKEKKEKKLKHEQFERDKTASIIQAIINGALAISNVWSTNAGMPILAAALTVVTAATTALQVAAIASQPNPYAKGSYIRGPQIALMGEEGDEWVASNKLLRDKKTAGIIETLDQYQKGNRNALTDLAFAVPSPKILSHTTPGRMRNFAPSNTTNNYYTNDEDPELLAEMRLLRKYLEDPRNRQAVINRNMLLRYEELENSVKDMARL